MLYIVKVNENGQIYEYEYGLLEHAQEHLRYETCHAELYVWTNGQEVFVEAVN